jgi:hypothetical protein
MRKIYLLIALLGVFSSGMAQTDATLYNMRAIPQSVYANPAFIPHFKINIGLPGISSIYGNVFNDGFTLKDMISPLDDSTVLVTPDVMLDKMGRRNLTGVAFNVDVLHVGFRPPQKKPKGTTFARM